MKYVRDISITRAHHHLQWYIIVPVLLMSLLSGGGEPPAGEGNTGAPSSGGDAKK